MCFKKIHFHNQTLQDVTELSYNRSSFAVNGVHFLESTGHLFVASLCAEVQKEEFCHVMHIVLALAWLN